MLTGETGNDVWQGKVGASVVGFQAFLAEASLKALGANFELDEVVVEALVKAKIRNLEEFRFFFIDGASVETWLGKITLGDNWMIQVARLRRAWSAVDLFFKQSEQDRSKVTAGDLDTMLEDQEPGCQTLLLEACCR